MSAEFSEDVLGHSLSWINPSLTVHLLSMWDDKDIQKSSSGDGLRIRHILHVLSAQIKLWASCEFSRRGKVNI